MHATTRLMQELGCQRDTGSVVCGPTVYNLPSHQGKKFSLLPPGLGCHGLYQLLYVDCVWLSKQPACHLNACMHLSHPL